MSQSPFAPRSSNLNLHFQHNRFQANLLVQYLRLPINSYRTLDSIIHVKWLIVAEYTLCLYFPDNIFCCSDNATTSSTSSIWHLTESVPIWKVQFMLPALFYHFPLLTMTPLPKPTTITPHQWWLEKLLLHGAG